jgi:hypothetical protein
MDMGDWELDPLTCAAIDGLVNDRLGIFRQAIAPYVELARETLERCPHRADDEPAILGTGRQHISFGQLRQLIEAYDRYAPLPPPDPQAYAEREAADRQRFSRAQAQVTP